MGEGKAKSGKAPPPAGRGKEAERQGRQAEALKRNLARRKAQRRARAEGAKEPSR